jgi:hypothetical protein
MKLNGRSARESKPYTRLDSLWPNDHSLYSTSIIWLALEHRDWMPRIWSCSHKSPSPCNPNPFHTHNRTGITKEQQLSQPHLTLGRILERCALNVETTSIRVMAVVVTCQNNSCLNGYLPSRLECPTCNKYVPIAGAQKFFLDESYQAWHSRFFLLRPRMLQVGM